MEPPMPVLTDGYRTFYARAYRGLTCIFGERSELMSIDGSDREVNFGERGWEYAYRDLCLLTEG